MRPLQHLDVRKDSPQIGTDPSSSMQRAVFGLPQLRVDSIGSTKNEGDASRSPAWTPMSSIRLAADKTACGLDVNAADSRICLGKAKRLLPRITQRRKGFPKTAYMQSTKAATAQCGLGRSV